MKYAKTMLLLALMTMPLWAASRLGPYTSVVAQVPFDFVVGDKVVPAGQLVVQPASLAEETISLRNIDAKVSMFSPASAVETRKASDSSVLVFHKYGERYFLSGIRLEGVRTSYEVPRGKAEKELMTQQAPFVENITISSLK